MNTSEPSNVPEMAKPPQTSLLQDLMAFLRYWLHTAWTRIGKRRVLVLLGVAFLGAGIALGWNWLAAIGIAPVLLSLAPCAAMCALGLCANKMMGGKSCSNDQQPDTAVQKKAETDPT